MNRETCKDLIVGIVTQSQGIKYLELLSKFVQLGRSEIETHSFIEMIEEVIQEGSVVEVTYRLPSIDYREKAIFFPKGTSVCITN